MQFKKRQTLLTLLLIATLLSGCMRIRVDALPTPPTVESAQSESTLPAAATSAQVQPATAAATKVSATETPLPTVTISAVDGNVFIRRGPDTAYNPIGVLYQGASANVLQRDVLSKWVEIIIPNSDDTGWVSLQTKYSKVDGDLASLPQFTITDWPVPAYLRNCSLHQMYVMPAEVLVPPASAFPNNEVWLYPGSYVVYDIDVPGEPEVLQFEMREGKVVEILDDGNGEHRKCR
ncbi:MAG: SH3 domain-containing protein [Chloroflexi bacterium]|nr:SH3 domain-containing protein [Chloroflexota bacterium]